MTMTPSAHITREHPLKIFGTHPSSQAYAIRDFLYRGGIPFEWVELMNDEQARQLAQLSGLNDSRLPVCLFPDGVRMENPSLQQIAEKLGWFRNPAHTEYDLAILGAGPAGLSAAVYGASEGLRTLLIERYAVGGQAGSSSSIENYLGFPKGISGTDLAHRAREQATRFGAEILLLHEGVRAEYLNGSGRGYLSDGSSFLMHSSICASGIEYRRLNLPNEERFRYRGLYYGAGASEASFCADEHVYVLGGGNSAGQAALHFSGYARKVTMIIRGDGLKQTLSQYLIDRIQAHPAIEILPHTEITELHGDDELRAITLANNQTGERRIVETCWLFLCLGGVPHTEWAKAIGIVCDEQDYLVTGPDLAGFRKHTGNWPLERPPYYLETSQPGLFAAGDVRHGSVKRCAAAVGEGAMAVTFAHRYLERT
jgi:thioredoxin reductase (NADPH)